MIDIKEHVRQEFIEALGEEKGLYWHDSLVWAKDERDRLARENERLREVLEDLAQLSNPPKNYSARDVCELVNEKAQAVLDRLAAEKST